MSFSPRAQRAALATACAFAALSGGCGSSSSSNPLAISHLQAVESPSNVLAYDVSWKTTQSADTELDVACSGLGAWTLSDATATTSHHVFVMGLATGVSCTLEAKASSADGQKASDDAKIKVGALPDYLPKVHVSLPAKPGSLAPGWTLVNLSNQLAGVPYVAALLDPEGRFRWYYQYPEPIPGSDTPVSQYENGVLIGGRDVPMTYVDWQGNRVWMDESGEYFHHEARPAETPGRVYTISYVKCASLQNFGDVIVEYDSASKQDVWTWRVCDHYTPPQDVPDWSHMNTIALFPDRKFLLASSRDQNSLLKIDRATGDLIWVMGYHGEVEDGFHGDFTIADADRFYHQHSAIVLPNGHILMFDNGRAGVREWSRALELAYTYNPSGTSEAHVVWQYRPKPDIFAGIWGSAQRLDNGNTLVCFGQRDPGTQSTIVEVSSDSTPLWEFVVPTYWGIYRAERIAEQHGFVLH